MDRLSETGTLQKWQKLEGKNKGKFKVVMDTTSNGNVDAEKIYGTHKADHKILNVAISLQHEFPKRAVVMVTKDINLRIKAKALNIIAEDYQTGKIKNVDSLYTGKATIENIDSSVIDKIYKTGFCEKEDLKIEDIRPHQYFILKSSKSSVLGYYNPVEDRVERIDKQAIHRIMPRNAEQVFALHALLILK